MSANRNIFTKLMMAADATQELDGDNATITELCSRASASRTRSRQALKGVSNIYATRRFQNSCLY